MTLTRSIVFLIVLVVRYLAPAICISVINMAANLARDQKSSKQTDLQPLQYKITGKTTLISKFKIEICFKMFSEIYF